MLSADAAARHPNQISILIYVEVLPSGLFGKFFDTTRNTPKNSKKQHVILFLFTE